MKINKIKQLVLGLALLCAMPALAQNKVIQGTVFDELGEPVIGATVQVKGTKYATVTDLDGNYKLEAPAGSKVTISYIGYVPLVTEGGRVSLQEDRNDLNEVIVVGYATQKMKNVTGSVEALSTDDIKDLSVGSLSDALQGQMNGLSVGSTNNRPGEAPSLQIRQSKVNSSLSAGATGGVDDSSPLYVIDDFISTEDAFNNLDVNEVESITILKDASAAVYGSRAAYGVVLVKTKKGKMGAPKITYTGQMGWTDAVYTPKMLSAYDYGVMWNSIKAAHTTTQDNVDIATQLFQRDELEQLKRVNYNLLDSEWKAALTQRHGVNVSGGTENATYFGNVSYFDQEGNIGKLDYDRWNFRAGITTKIGKYVNAAMQVSGDFGEKTNAIQVKGGGTDGDYYNLMAHLPFVPSYMNGYPLVYTGMTNDPNVNLSDKEIYNFAAVQNSPDRTRERTNNFNINGSLDFDFSWIKPLKGLHAKLSYSKSFSNTKTGSIKTTMNVYGLKNRGGFSMHLYSWDGMDPATAYAYENLRVYELNNGNIIENEMSQSESYQFNFTLNYARKFGKHDVSALFSVEKSESEYEWLYGSRTNPYDFADGTFFSASGDRNNNNSKSEAGMLSYIGRLNYAYADKYLFEFLLRSDASTKFAPENYWGTFPSVSAGWVVSEENWFRDNVKWIDFLKLRASWGMLGRDNISAWIWTQKYGYKNEAAKLGTDPTKAVSDAFQIPAKGENRDVHWDKNYKTNFGIDLAFLNNRLSVNFDYYYDKGREMFATYTGTSMYPTTVGTQATPENYGKIDTWGWELNLSWRDNIGKDIKYWAKLSTGWSDNKILAANFPATPEYDSIVYGERQDRGVWGLKCLGMFRSYQEIAEYFQQNNIRSYFGKNISDMHPGMLIYQDISGDNDGNGNYGGPDCKITDSDVIRLSKYSTNPYHFTTNFGISYRDFSLSAQLYAAWGAYNVVNSDLRQAFGADDTEFFNRPAFWKDMFVYENIYGTGGADDILVPQNLTAKYPNMAYYDVNQKMSSFWLVNAATIELRNITLAWTMPKKWINPIGLSNVRWNLTCQNALYFLNPYPGDAWAPYAGNYGKYPRLRKFTIGVNVSF